MPTNTFIYLHISSYTLKYLYILSYTPIYLKKSTSRKMGLDIRPENGITLAPEHPPRSEFGMHLPTISPEALAYPKELNYSQNPLFQLLVGGS